MSQAVKDLQDMLNNNGANLAVDGDLGPKTKAAIDALNVPIWLKVALKEVGVHEIRGGKHSTRVLEYHSTTGKYSNDEVPWCGSFVNWVLLQAGFSKTVAYAERAKSWAEFGKEVDSPLIGAIAVKSRKGGGHVGFVVAVDGNSLYLLGGNQSDEVNIRRYRVQDFMTFRVPWGYGNAHYADIDMYAPMSGSEA